MTDVTQISDDPGLARVTELLNRHLADLFGREPRYRYFQRSKWKQVRHAKRKAAKARALRLFKADA